MFVPDFIRALYPPQETITPLCEYTLTTARSMLARKLASYLEDRIEEYKAIPWWQPVARYRARCALGAMVDMANTLGGNQR